MSAEDPRGPARVAPGGRVEDSLLSPGCVVRGEVVRSVLGPGAVVERGACVRDCILLDDVRVGSGALLQGAIADMRSRVGEGARAGEPVGDDASSAGLVVIEMEGRVAPGAPVPPGTEVRRATAGDRALAV